MKKCTHAPRFPRVHEANPYSRTRPVFFSFQNLFFPEKHASAQGSEYMFYEDYPNPI